MLVYRFENERGFGPYCSAGCRGELQYALQSELCQAHCDGYHRPVWYIKGFKSGEMFCGCISIDSLRVWFDGFIDKLFIAGYHIACYDVPACDIYYGSNQVAFAWENAELVERIKQNNVP